MAKLNKAGNPLASPRTPERFSDKTSQPRPMSATKRSFDGSPKTQVIGGPTSTIQLKRQAKALLSTRKALPIWAHQADIRWSLRHVDVLLLVGETGSGKSTQVPQFLHNEPWCKKQRVKVEGADGRKQEKEVGGMIAITEPRRVAAMTLARRVAKEMGSPLGAGPHVEGQVGYSVRFDTNVPKGTKVKFLTEGMLLQELLRDPNLCQYSAVIIDEIHERSVDVDLLAGFMKQIVSGDKKGRGGIPLKVIIMSATANMEGIRDFFAKDYEGTTNGTFSSCPEINGDENWDNESRRGSDASFSSWEGFSSETQDESSPQMKTKPEKKRSRLEEVKNPKLRFDRELNRDLRIPSPPLSENGIATHHIEGKMHAVKIMYTPEPVGDYIDAMVKTIFQIHTREPLPGDILAFLTGQEEIETLQKLVEQYGSMLAKGLPRVKVFPLYGQLSALEQQKAFEPVQEKFTRKVVLATNIAETSVTVSGVRHVVDCGKVKVKQFRPGLGLESLLIKPISKSSAIQRKGRAGREAVGTCYRLYTEKEYLSLPDSDLPEIRRSDIAEAVLNMKARGVEDPFSFPLMDAPTDDSIAKALLRLYTLGALDDEGKLRDDGRKMATLPLTASYGKVLIEASRANSDCLLQAIDIISCLSAGEDVFHQRTSADDEDSEDPRGELLRREGDVLTYLTAMQKYAAENTNRIEWCRRYGVSIRVMKQASQIRKQLRDLSVRMKLLDEAPAPDPQPFSPLSPGRAEDLLKCFLTSFALKTATLQADGSYATTHGKHTVTIHPSSVLHGKKKEAIMFLEHVFTQKSYAKKVSAIQMDWISAALERS